MSVLSICQTVALYSGIEEPELIVGSTERTYKEMFAMLKECAQSIHEAHDWQALKALQTMTGDGTTIAFDLPSDYFKMPKDQEIWSSRLDGPFYHIISHDKWLELDVRSYEFVRGVWTLLGNQVQIKPVMGTGETASYYYQSKNIWTQDSASVAEPTSDSATFRLPERLLRLGLTWQWKQLKNLPYAEDMQTAELALADAIERDKGARMVRIGQARMPSGVNLSYPQTIVT